MSKNPMRYPPSSSVFVWLRQHPKLVAIAFAVALYLYYIFSKAYGVDPVNYLVAYVIIGVILPNLHHIKEVILRRDPQELINAWLRMAFTTVSFIGVGVVLWVLVIYYPRPYSVYGEMVALLVGIGIGIYWKKGQHFSLASAAVIAFLAYWLVASAIDVVYLKIQAPIPPDTTAAERPDQRHPKIGLALSGGGYRAAVMHAGVVDALESLNAPPTHISTVSGGAIFGAYYAAGGTPADFKQLMYNKLFNLKRELFGLPNPVFLIAPAKIPFTDFELLPDWHFSRTDVQQNLMEKLVAGDRAIDDLKGKVRLLVAMTDLISGQAISASSNGFMISPRASLGYNSASVSVPLRHADPYLLQGSQTVVENLRLSTFVTASGAFPIAFTAIDVPVGRTKFSLADGGIIDNSGIGVLLDADYLARNGRGMTDWALDLVVSSDGGQLFRPDDNPGLIRFIDIIHSISTPGFASGRTGSKRHLPVIHIGPSNVLSIVETEDNPSPEQRVTQIPIKGSSGRNFDMDVNWATVLPQHIQRLEDLLSAAMKKRLKNKIDESAAVRMHMSDAQASEYRNTLLKSIINDELRNCITTFKDMSTLEDQMAQDQIDDLYRLGQFLVYLSWPAIQAQLQ